MRAKLAIVALFLACLSATTTAEDSGKRDNYFGVSTLHGTYSFDSASEVDAKTLNVSLGWMLNERLGVEGRFGLGFGDENVGGCHYVNGQLECTRTKIKVSHYLGAYARGYILPNGPIRPYLVGGYVTAQSSITLDDISSNAESHSVNGLSYGAGIEAGSDRFRATLEYMSLFDTGGHTVDGISFGFLITY